MTTNNKVITSTVEAGRPTGMIETPQVKVSQRRNVPIGENIRDAIKSIKGTHKGRKK